MFANRIVSACAVMALASVVGLPHAQAAEILVEEGPKRVVTGDWATWTTRGIEEKPVPWRVPQPRISEALQRCGAEDGVPCAGAMAEGIVRHGWAQFEQEPIGGSGTKVQVLVEKVDKPVLRVRVFDDPDIVAAATGVKEPI